MRFHCYVMAAIFSVCCHGQFDFSQRPQEHQDWEKYASELLNGTTSLIVLLSKETRIDRPICWSTKKATNLRVGFHHYLTYFKKDSTGHRKYGTWLERNTMWYVGPINKEPTILLEASVHSGGLDKIVSGDYDLFYANTSCFIMATRPASKDKLDGNSSLQMLQNNSRCLLWAPEGTTISMIKDCHSAFLSNCSSFGCYRFRYNETTCKNRNVTVRK
uniref:Lipocalin n=1 Tax=Rhipicephalus appendiculatus TaxID=34631 RepID=A0A131YYU4_RHIAP